MSNALLSKGLSLVRGWFEPPPEKVLERIRDELRECAYLIGGEVSARQRAAKLAKTYAELDENGRRAFLRILLTEFTVSPGGRFTAWYEDDDMFWGHVITVDGTLKKGPVDADIQG